MSINTFISYKHFLCHSNEPSFFFCVIPRALARGTSYTIERGNWPLSTISQKNKNHFLGRSFRTKWEISSVSVFGWSWRRGLFPPPLMETPHCVRGDRGNGGDPSQRRLGVTALGSCRAKRGTTLKKLSGTKQDFSSVYVSVMQNRTTWVSWFLIKFL